MTFAYGLESRVRKVEHREGFFHHSIYEVALVDENGRIRVLERTKYPTSVLMPRNGVGDSWCLVQLADEAFLTAPGKWVNLYGVVPEQDATPQTPEHP